MTYRELTSRPTSRPHRRTRHLASIDVVLVGPVLGIGGGRCHGGASSCSLTRVSPPRCAPPWCACSPPALDVRPLRTADGRPVLVSCRRSPPRRPSGPPLMSSGGAVRTVAGLRERHPFVGLWLVGLLLRVLPGEPPSDDCRDPQGTFGGRATADRVTGNPLRRLRRCIRSVAAGPGEYNDDGQTIDCVECGASVPYGRLSRPPAARPGVRLGVGRSSVRWRSQCRTAAARPVSPVAAAPRPRPPGCRRPRQPRPWQPRLAAAPVGPQPATPVAPRATSRPCPSHQRPPGRPAGDRHARRTGGSPARQGNPVCPLDDGHAPGPGGCRHHGRRAGDLRARP